MTLYQFNQLDEMEQVETPGREEKAKFDGKCYKIDGLCTPGLSNLQLIKRRKPKIL